MRRLSHWDHTTPEKKSPHSRLTRVSEAGMFVIWGSWRLSKKTITSFPVTLAGYDPGLDMWHENGIYVDCALCFSARDGAISDDVESTPNEEIELKYRCFDEANDFGAFSHWVVELSHLSCYNLSLEFFIKSSVGLLVLHHISVKLANMVAWQIRQRLVGYAYLVPEPLRRPLKPAY